MYAYAVVSNELNNDIQVQYCFGIYLNEEKATLVANDLNKQYKEIKILEHSGDDLKKLSKLKNQYEKLLVDKFHTKDSIGIYYYNIPYWDVEQIVIVE